VTTEIDEKTIEQLAKLHRGIASEAKQSIELYRRLLELRIADSYLPTLNAHISSFAKRFIPSPLTGEGKGEGGNFVLQFEDLLQDWAPLQELFQEASSIVSEYFSSSDSKVEKFPPWLIKKAANAWYQYSPLHPIADEIGVAWETLSLCFQTAFHPILIRYSEALSPLIIQDSWRRRTCPICGGKPDIAFLSKDNGARWLVCSRCDTEWLFFRLECPFCGNRDQERLAYLTDEKELYRLYTCEQCRNYIKAIDLRRTDQVLFPLERVLTLDMDRQAHEAGYKPG